MDLTPGPPRQAPAEIIMRQLPQGLNFGHLLDISGRAADRLDAEGWLLTEERREEIRAAAYRAGWEDAAKARCPNCEHETRMHGDDGCWFCLDVGVVGESLVCKCPAMREGIARGALARAGSGSLTGDQIALTLTSIAREIARAGQHPRTPGEDVTP